MRSRGNIIIIFQTFHNMFEKMVEGSTTRRPITKAVVSRHVCLRVDGVRLTVLSPEGGGPGTREVLKVFVLLDSANKDFKVLQYVYGLALLISQQLNTDRE